MPLLKHTAEGHSIHTSVSSTVIHYFINQIWVFVGKEDGKNKSSDGSLLPLRVVILIWAVAVVRKNICVCLCVCGRNYFGYLVVLDLCPLLSFGLFTDQTQQHDECILPTPKFVSLPLFVCSPSDCNMFHGLRQTGCVTTNTHSWPDRVWESVQFKSLHHCAFKDFFFLFVLNKIPALVISN